MYIIVFKYVVFDRLFSSYMLVLEIGTLRLFIVSLRDKMSTVVYGLTATTMK